MDNEKVKCIFKGDVKRKLWDVNTHLNYYSKGYAERPELYTYTETVSNKDFFEKEISKPTYNVNEKIYINELALIVYITEKIRSTNEEIIYMTTHTIEILEDEVSAQSKIEAKSKLEVELIKYEKSLHWKTEKYVEDVADEPIKKKRFWF